ncbi:MAG: ribosome small subunit-dependent GTPase A [Bacteroidales bacterium]|nr:ribosome small subunit-dependent GTPase A [Bacteroidales bacterium]
MKGIVIKSTGNIFIVKDENNNRVECKLRGAFRLKGHKSTNPVVVGDYVDFIFDEEQNTGQITELLDRKNFIIRKSVKLSKQTHIIAANIDTAFLIVTLTLPKTPWNFIDKYLATCEAYHVPAVLVFNKIDIYDEKLNQKLQETIDIYEKIGYKCIKVSATENVNLDELKLAMKDKTSLFSGVSGAGKTTIINKIEPDLNLKTAKISGSYSKGVHTTTFSEMFELSFGGYIIDTPGLQEFEVLDFELYEITHFFPEMFKLLPECQYNNCMHVTEPNCAVKKAVKEGNVSESRYRNYINILNYVKELKEKEFKK